MNSVLTLVDTPPIHTLHTCREKRILFVAEVEAACVVGVGGQLPPHPDPEDRGLSKRAWEGLIYL